MVVGGAARARLLLRGASSTQDDVKKAPDVFTGTITDIARSGSARRGTVTYDVAVQRVYKGNVSSDRVSVTTARDAGQCGLGDLRADRRYVFFAKPSGTALAIESCSSTGPARAGLVATVERLLGAGRGRRPRRPPRRRSSPGSPTAGRRASPAWPRPGSRWCWSACSAWSSSAGWPGTPDRSAQRYIPPDSPGRCGSAEAWVSSTAGCPPTPAGSARRICSNCARAAICWA